MIKNFVHDQLRRNIFIRSGIDAGPINHMPSLESLRKTEWSLAFEKLMRNRLIMGAIRYGLMGAMGKSKYDRIGSIKKRLKLYEKSGNAENLVDIANLCLLEFEEPNHENFHMKSVDDGHHVSVIK